MILHETQKLVAQDNHRFRVVNCGRQWGKTTLSVLEMIAVAIYGNDREVHYIAPTYQQARDICWFNLKKLCAPIAKTVNESRLEIIVNTKEGGTSRISLRGWESIETMRGQQSDFMVLDEISIMRQFEVRWQEILLPCLSFRQGSVLFISTPKGYNHFYDLTLEEIKSDEFKSFHFTSYDNPFLKTEEIDRAKKILSVDSFAQEYMAEFKKMEGLVYPEFSRDTCVVNPNPDELKILKMKMLDNFGGVDFGYTNPTVVLKIGRDHDGTYWIMDEWVRTEKTNDEMIEYARTMGISAFYPDPAEPDRIIEMKRCGLNCREVNKDIEKGVDTVRSLLKMGKLKVLGHCRSTIAEFEMYAYPDSKGERNPNEKPIDLNNHCMDAMRYVLFMLASPASQAGKVGVHYATGARPISPVQRPSDRATPTIHYPTPFKR